jgi:hypothetical protein
MCRAWLGHIFPTFAVLGLFEADMLIRVVLREKDKGGAYYYYYSAPSLITSAHPPSSSTPLAFSALVPRTDTVIWCTFVHCQLT